MGWIKYQEVSLTGSCSSDNEAFSDVINGYLDMIAISTQVTAGSSGLSTTGIIQFSGEKSGIVFLRILPPAAGGSTTFPRGEACKAASSGGSSGALFAGDSTGNHYLYKFPISEERIRVASSSGAGVTPGYNHTIRIMTEGA